MPQLDTIYTLMTYLWTWLILHLTTQKIKIFLMTTNPTTQSHIKLMTSPAQWL